MYNDSNNQRVDDLVRQHAPLVKRIAYHLMARMPSSVQLDDLIQSGMIGLLEAATKYDASRGASFDTYASIRIRGAMVDELRRGDWVPRSVHREARRISEAMQVVEGRTGRDASDQEVADELGMSLAEYHTCLREAASGQLFSVDELGETLDSKIGGAEGHASPEENTAQGLFLEQLAQEIDQLPERERLVMALYYDEELNLKEIGAVLEVSESRVSQLHSQAALRLRGRLKAWQG